jgi:hypothetical protein
VYHLSQGAERGVRASGRRISLAAFLFTLLLLTLAGPARAALFFDGPRGFGVSEASALASGLPIRIVPHLIPAQGLLAVHPPRPGDPALATKPSLDTPNLVPSVWDIDQVHDRDLPNVWLVFLSPLTYEPSLVGFDLLPHGPSLLIQLEAPVDQQPTTLYYPAFGLGDLAADGIVGDVDASLSLTHAIATDLMVEGPNRVLPRYGLALFVPEPRTLTMVALLLSACAVLSGRWA